MSYFPTPIKQEEGLWHILPFMVIRQTPSVDFHAMPVFPKLSAIDRVLHGVGAKSPQAPGTGVERPWYMHPSQDDNLVVFSGTRVVELYTPKHGKVEKFFVTADKVTRENGEVLYEGPCVFGWPPDVFHRIESPEGSMSINFAQHFEGFSIKTNFNIYDVNAETGEYRVIREGHQDQPKGLDEY